MARLEIDRDSYGSVRDPETDEYVDIDEDLEPEVAERIADEYDPITVADEDEDEGEGEEAGDEIGQLLDENVPEVGDAIESGDHDGRLDEIAERADRDGVQDAVDDRRDALEE